MCQVVADESQQIPLVHVGCLWLDLMRWYQGAQEVSNVVRAAFISHAIGQSLVHRTEWHAGK